jgi:integrase
VPDPLGAGIGRASAGRTIASVGARIAQRLIAQTAAVWTAAQTAQFLTATRGHRLYAIYHLIALLGLRRGEAAGLRWCDVDLGTGTAVISQQLQQHGGRLEITPPKTPYSARVIALDHTTVAALCENRRRQRAEAASGGPGYQASGYVFTNRRGGPMAPDRLTRIFGELTGQADLPLVRLHDLRHGAATLALSAGVDLRTCRTCSATPASC